ncbi:MAG: S9 family peptidase [Pseudomonadota bacterium]|jgi:Dipeptidyl aminopeptidases/acylaminoacyl-peptidases|nr:MAG: peptidase S9, prolyl oligopeptidase [Pseudomonadota bacterium]
MPERVHIRALGALVLLQLTYVAALPAAAQSAGSPPPVLRQERGNLILENIPERDPQLAERLQRYLHARQATFRDWLPDGSMLISTRFGNTEQIHRLTAPMGARQQLTFYDEPITTALAPQTGAADGFVFLKDRGGDENAQIHYYRFADRSVRLLTDGKSRYGSPVWSNDGRRVAFFGNVRDGVSYDIFFFDVTSDIAPRLMVGGQQGTWYPLDWSPDDRKLLVQNYVSINESYLHIADVATGSLTPLDTSGRKIGIHAARFAPDGRGVYVVSDEKGEFAQLRYVDTVTGQSRDITAHIPWDIEAFDASVDGRYLAWVANEDGISRLTVLDNVAMRELAVPGLPQGLITNLKFDRTGRRLALSVESPQVPRDVYVYEIERNELVRWTNSEAGPVDIGSFVPAELVRYPTWDRVNGRQRLISAFVYRPRTPGPHPVVINIHGGPESQYRPGFEPFIQFLVNELGYAVVAPNVRGSSGYGKTFLRLDNGMLRQDAVKDIGSLLVWIGMQPDLDRERVVVMGGSYGGYMTLASLVAYSDRLRGGIDVVGISNFVTFLENTSGYRRDLRRAEYGDERDPKMRAFLTRISPLTNASHIRRPLLVVQGLNDPRVPASESEQMVAKIRASGGEVWYLAAKDEGHGFRKKQNRDFYLEVTAQFLERLARK